MRKLTTVLLSSALLLACSGPRSEQQAPSTPNKPSSPVAGAPAQHADTATIEKTTMPTPPTKPSADGKTELATFANGCFWCTEAVLEQVDGVIDATSGYMGGDVDKPSYQDVCTGTTGHAECVQVTFDPKKISYETLLDWFFHSHDPTTKDRQGNDIGTQYRSAIFCHSPEQEKAAHAAIAKLQPKLEDPIVTEVTPASTFWPAEKYHQDYYRQNQQQPYCRMMIAPKLKKLGLDAAPKNGPASDGAKKK